MRASDDPEHSAHLTQIRDIHSEQPINENILESLQPLTAEALASNPNLKFARIACMSWREIFPFGSRVMAPTVVGIELLLLLLPKNSLRSNKLKKERRKAASMKRQIFLPVTILLHTLMMNQKQILVSDST